MGVYSTNRSSNLGFEDIAMAEGYTGAVGINTILIESTENDMAMFNAILASDFQEAVSLKEGVLTESEMLVIQEGVIANIYGKIKEFLKKLVAKIKAIFHQFMAKINGIIMSDNKELVKKYQKEVISKDVSKMEYKWQEPTDADFAPPASKDFMAIKTATADTLDKVVEDLQNGTVLEKLLGQSIGKTTVEVKEYSKEAHLFMFKEEDTKTGPNMRDIVASLTTAAATTKMAKETNDKTIKAISAHIKDIEQEQKATSDALTKSTEEEDASKRLASRKANAQYTHATVVQSAILRVTSASMEAAKFEIKQARRVFMQAVSYNPKKEDVDFMLAVAESSDAELEMDFEDPTSIEAETEE